MGNTAFNGRRSDELSQGVQGRSSTGEGSGSAGGVVHGGTLFDRDQQFNKQYSNAPVSPLTYSTTGVGMYGLQNDLYLQQSQYIGGYNNQLAAAQPKLLPTVIVWPHGGMNVEVQGSFDDWQARHQLTQSGGDWIIIKLLPPGIYQYKFVVDNTWRHDPEQPQQFDDVGNCNNVIEVQEYVPDNLEGLQVFKQPQSPQNSYAALDIADVSNGSNRDPPALPPHLSQTLLNMSNNVNGSSQSQQGQAGQQIVGGKQGDVLPRPQHVVLNHTYKQNDSLQNPQSCVLGTTHRYKSKYVTVIMYKQPNTQKGTNFYGDAPGGLVDDDGNGRDDMTDVAHQGESGVEGAAMDASQGHDS